MSMVKENLVSQIWSRQLLREGGLSTAEGERVWVLFPGRESKDSGPDFRDAILGIGSGEPLRGDVEVHVRSGDWRAHGHHRDPEYNGVILHVVMWDDGEGVTVLESGDKVPVLSLQSHLKVSLDEAGCSLEACAASRNRCQGVLGRHGKTDLGNRLGQAGVERFKLKVEEFRVRLEAEDRDEVLYSGIMRGLGYAKNKQPFEELARRLPLRALRELASGEDLREMQALMLGSAGLLPSQRGGSGVVSDPSIGTEIEADDLERRWLALGMADTMNPKAWRFFRVRPENFPPRRIMAASHIVSRYGGGFLQDVVYRASRGPTSRVLDDLAQSLMVCAVGYWASHYDFGVPARGNPRLIGPGRAREIVVNVLLPFLSAWGERCSLCWLRERALHLYQNVPRLGENWITRYMEKQVLGEDESIATSACQQQGLIYLYQVYCLQRRCCDCPLG